MSTCSRARPVPTTSLKCAQAGRRRLPDMTVARSRSHRDRINKLRPEFVIRGITLHPNDIPGNLEFTGWRRHDDVEFFRSQVRPVQFRPRGRYQPTWRQLGLRAVRELDDNFAVSIRSRHDSLIVDGIPWPHHLRDFGHVDVLSRFRAYQARRSSPRCSRSKSHADAGGFMPTSNCMLSRSTAAAPSGQ